jgi:hypothetical protein
MDQCKKKYGSVKDQSKTVKDIEKFCELLQTNKVKDSKEAFAKLPMVVQCLFLHHAWNILSKKSKHSEDSYLTAFYLFKLFRGKEMKEQEIYSKYTKLKTLEKMYKSALEWNRKSSPSKPKSSTSSKSPGLPKSSKKYDKEYQRYEGPKDELDPLYVYYTSLYIQNPKSRLAITWLTEHGVYEDSDREKIVKIYKKLAEAGKLIK